MTSNQHGPYVRGYTRVTMGGHRGLLPGDGTPIPKPSLSTDWSLQPDSTKLDSLVIAHQPPAVPEVRNRKGRPRVKPVIGAKS